MLDQRSRILERQGLAVQETIEHFAHGNWLVIGRTETCSLNGHQSKIPEVPDEAANLILSFVEARNPPLSPNPLDRHLQSMSQILHPFLRTNDRYVRIKISSIDPLHKTKFTILSLLWMRNGNNSKTFRLP
jgi:hypothetical protein